MFLQTRPISASPSSRFLKSRSLRIAPGSPFRVPEAQHSISPSNTNLKFIVSRTLHLSHNSQTNTLFNHTYPLTPRPIPRISLSTPYVLSVQPIIHALKTAILIHISSRNIPIHLRHTFSRYLKGKISLFLVSMMLRIVYAL